MDKLNCSIFNLFICFFLFFFFFFCGGGLLCGGFVCPVPCLGKSLYTPFLSSMADFNDGVAVWMVFNYPISLGCGI